jgi:hypothetical protein
MSAFFSPDDSTGEPYPSGIEPQPTARKRRPQLFARVGAVLLRRIKYIARACYWTWMHGSTKHVAWVLAYEGYTW